MLMHSGNSLWGHNEDTEYNDYECVYIRGYNGLLYSLTERLSS